MQATSTDKHLLRLIGVAFLLSFSLTANAVYVVLDDDLMPTRAPDPQQLPTAHYAIPFAKEHSPLGNAGRAALDAIIPQMRDQKVQIIGRPDATTYMGGKLAQLANNRANVIRNYLLREGVPANSIAMEIDNTPNPQTNGSIYPSDIYISRTQENHQPRPYLSANQPNAPTYTRPAVPASFDQTMGYIQPTAPGYAQPTPPPIQQIPRAGALIAARSQIIQFISRATQTGQMDPVAALKMIQTLSNTDMDSGPQTANAAPMSQPITPAPLFVAANNTVRKQFWQLETTKTLRDNIDAWALRGGWNPTQWLATNYYQVTTASTLEGDFPDVLRQIADSTKLNICIYQRDKRIKVTDANISCKD